MLPCDVGGNKLFLRGSLAFLRSPVPFFSFFFLNCYSNGHLSQMEPSIIFTSSFANMEASPEFYYSFVTIKESSF